MDGLQLHNSQSLSFGPLTLPSRFLLSPLAGYTNLPFRLAVRELGGLGLATTDLVNARALLRVQCARRCELIADLSTRIARSPCRSTAPTRRKWPTRPAGSKTTASPPWTSTWAARSHKVVHGGGGSAMMCNVAGTTAMVRAVVEAVRIPVTVKMRLGWDEHNLTAPSLAREFEQAGVAAVTIHGRTRDQGFTGSVNLDGIRAVVEAVERIPIIGNGDVRTIADAERMLHVTGCAGMSIGRGALLNPWIFAQLARCERTGDPGEPPTYRQRLDFMSRHFHLLVDQRGERFACLTFRKVANWYCRVLRPGRDIQQRLMRLERPADFDAMVAQLHEQGPPPHWQAGALPEIAVPQGPNERW